MIGRCPDDLWQTRSVGGQIARRWSGLMILIVALTFSIGCESGTEPEPQPGYLLYAAMHGTSEGWIAVIDCATDSVIDSIAHGFQTGPGVVASPDGKYFAVLGSSRPPEIFDAVSRTQIKYLAAPALKALFLPAEQLVISPDYSSTRVYSMPGFQLRETWLRPRWFTEPVGSLGRFASLDSQSEQPPRNDLHKIVIFSPDGAPIDSFSIIQGNAALNVHCFTFSPDGTRFYGGVYGGGKFYIAGYDLTGHTMLFLHQPTRAFQHCFVSPDGREVWVTDHGDLYGFNPEHRGSTDVYDAFTGSLIDSVVLSGSYADSSRTLAPWSVRFVPGSEKVYINSVAGGQPMLVVNSRTKEIERVIFPEFDKWVEEIDIAPRP